MCSIAGVLNMTMDDKTSQTLLDTMHRRGPDQNGKYIENGCCLLHSRLSIIDPDGGRQPMEVYWKGQNFVIVYNGELYNAAEIRQELEKQGHFFFSSCDTEVVLRAYIQWKERALEHLNGIFAFAVWETDSRKLFIARDRIGVKPLFYRCRNGTLIFASEIKTILRYPGVPAQLDISGAAQILLLGPGRIQGSGVFKNIEELKPGHYGIFQNGKLCLHRYWSLKDREHTETLEETAEEVRFLVTDSIKRQMVSDMPLGTFLSGGLDSSIITAVCAGESRRQGSALDTFSVDYQDNDKYFVPGKFQPNSDGAYIEIMRSTLATEHHSTVLSPDDLINALEQATLARDLPGMADVDFSLLCFCGHIRNHVKVALSGECADEIFGGYPWYRDPEVRSLDGFPWAQNTKYRASFLQEDIAKQLDPESFVIDLYQQTIRNSDILPGTDQENVRIKQMVNLNFNWFMQTLLDRKDRMSMYHSLEVRVPFCDHRIAEYMYGVPWKYKEYNGTEKGLLRYAMQDLLPKEVLWRKKSPYPKTYDPRYLEIVSDRLRQLLGQSCAPIHGVIKTDALRSLLQAEYTWPWYGQLMKLPQTIAFMLQIDFWLREYSVEICW